MRKLRKISVYLISSKWKKTIKMNQVKIHFHKLILFYLLSDWILIHFQCISDWKLRLLLLSLLNRKNHIHRGFPMVQLQILRSGRYKYKLFMSNCYSLCGSYFSAHTKTQSQPLWIKNLKQVKHALWTETENHWNIQNVTEPAKKVFRFIIDIRNLMNDFFCPKTHSGWSLCLRSKKEPQKDKML